MIKTDLVLPYGYDQDTIKTVISERLPIKKNEIKEIRLLKRELVVKDGKTPFYKTTVAFSSESEKENGLLKIKNRVSLFEEEAFTVKAARFDTRPVVAGAGPAGLFAALTLAESGACPVVIERGLEVYERAKKINTFEKLGILDTECNVQFGEGGAGTYSDGKLKTGAKDKYKFKVLDEFILGGADESILYSTTAHLGTDKLPDIVKCIREKIISLGGEFIFSAKLTDIIVKNNELVGIRYEKDGEPVILNTDTLILAIGHSARDTIRMLKEKGLHMRAKGFGIGMRIEHPREYINKIVYREATSVIEETASYHLVTHLPSGRSVYSFCMCPGGEVVAATSEKDAIVTNGMSKYARMSDNSNAALLVSVTPEDFGSDDPLAGIELQREIERAAYNLSGTYKAPMTRLSSLMSGGKETELTSVNPSYPIGTFEASPFEYLPRYIPESIVEAIPDFDNWLPGYYYADAVLTGPETRTTSPVRIERDESGCAPGFLGLYPTGEGAGYAGGIVSSAVDGIKMAEKSIEKHLK
jgi:uncharacterized FAD-dependent dehydrogenase